MRDRHRGRTAKSTKLLIANATAQKPVPIKCIDSWKFHPKDMRVASSGIVADVGESEGVEEGRRTRRSSADSRRSYHGTVLRISNNCALR